MVQTLHRGDGRMGFCVRFFGFELLRRVNALPYAVRMRDGARLSRSKENIR